MSGRAAFRPEGGRQPLGVRVQLERPPAFNLIATEVVSVIQSGVPVGKDVVGLPVVPAAAVIVLQNAVEAGIVLGPRNDVLKPLRRHLPGTPA